MWERILRLWKTGGKNIKWDQGEFIDMEPLSGVSSFNMESCTIKQCDESLLEELIEAFTKHKLLKRSYRCLLSLCFNNIHIHSVNSVTLENPD